MSQGSPIPDPSNMVLLPVFLAIPGQAWGEQVAVDNVDTGGLFDLLTATQITVGLLDDPSAAPVQTVTMTGGQVHVAGPGIFRFEFSAGQMRELKPQSHLVKVTVTDASGPAEEIVGQVIAAAIGSGGQVNAA